MSDALQFASVGQVLRDARETQGITLDDVALRLRLMHRQIEAMETDNFESLGQPVFARGFVRNYARLLGLQPDPLLEQMGGAPAEPGPVAQAEAPMPRSWLTSPWLILFMLGMLAVVAVPVSLYLWLNSEPDEMQHAGQAVVASSPVAPLSEVPDAPLPAAVSAASPEPAAAVMPDAALSSVPETDMVTPTPDPAESAAPASPETTGVVHLEFGEEAWVEVKDATGRLLHRQLNAAGSNVDIRGQPPFEMVIGNAGQARMTYNGRPIDLKPFIAVTVARFTLEE